MTALASGPERQRVVMRLKIDEIHNSIRDLITTLIMQIFLLTWETSGIELKLEEIDEKSMWNVNKTDLQYEWCFLMQMPWWINQVSGRKSDEWDYEITMLFNGCRPTSHCRLDQLFEPPKAEQQQLWILENIFTDKFLANSTASWAPKHRQDGRQEQWPEHHGQIDAIGLQWVGLWWIVEIFPHIFNFCFDF